MPLIEKHTGTVVDNDDPEKNGRLTISCPTVVGNDVLEWCLPKFHFVDSANNAGAFWVPNVNSEVEVEISADEDAEVNGLEAKWICSVYPFGTVPTEFQQNYPQRRGWKTKAGHLLYFDDTDGENVFYYKHPSGTEIVVTNSGNIELKPTGTQSVLIGDGADQQIPRGNILDTFLDAFTLWAKTHVHPATGGTTSPPSTPPPDNPPNLLSDYHKVK